MVSQIRSLNKIKGVNDNINSRERLRETRDIIIRGILYRWSRRNNPLRRVGVKFLREGTEGASKAMAMTVSPMCPVYQKDCNRWT